MLVRYYVADIHINDDQPYITDAFIAFLNQLKSGSELYILGDLFDFSAGDDLLTSSQIEIQNALSLLKDRDIKSYFIHGNRDFMIGKLFARKTHIKLLPDYHVVSSHNHKILLLHGDLLCTDDKGYLRYRKCMHSRILQRIFLWLGKSIRKKIGLKIRSESKRKNKQKSYKIMDVNQEAVLNSFKRFDADMMIHGHTHLLNIHQHKINEQKTAERWVLGAWHDSFNYIYQDENGQLKFMNL